MKSTLVLSRVVGSFLLLLGLIEIAIGLIVVWRYGCHPCRRLRSLYKDVRGWLRQFSNIGMCKGVHDDALRTKIVDQADRKRIERARWNLRMCILLVVPLTYRSFFVAQILLSAESKDFVSKHATVFFHIPIEVAAIVFILWPATLTKFNMRLIFNVVLSRNVYTAISRTVDGVGELSPARREIEDIFNHILRLWFGLVLQDGPYIVASHLVVVPITIGIYYIVDFNEDTLQDIFAELLLTGLVCVACVAAERATTSSIHASIQAQSSRALTAAVDTLLSSVCDAVVNLTRTYEFSRDCPRLSAILLRNPSVPLEGNVCDFFLSDTDEIAFKNFMQAGGQAHDTLAPTLHITLRDMNGAPVAVQLFHVACHGVTSDEVHIIGIRDLGGERHPVPQSEEDQDETLGSAPDRSPPKEHNTILMPIIEDSHWESEPESASGSAQPIPIAASEEDMAKVWVCAQDHALPILQWTPAFISIVGRSAIRYGADVLDISASSLEKERLLRELQSITNVLLYGDAEAQAGLQLDISTQRLGVIRVNAQVRMAFDNDSESEEDGNRSVAHGGFVLEIELKSWRRTKRSGGTSKEWKAFPQRPSVSIQSDTAKTSTEEREQTAKKVSL